MTICEYNLPQTLVGMLYDFPGYEKNQCQHTRSYLRVEFKLSQLSEM